MSKPLYPKFRTDDTPELSPDIILENSVANKVYLCWKYGVGGEEDAIWKICEIETTTPSADVTKRSFKYPFGVASYDFKISDIPTLTFQYLD